MLKPSLNLNFAETKELDRRLIYTRSDWASHVGEDGLFKFDPSNKPRFDHDIVSKESLGLLIESGSSSYVNDNTNYLAFDGISGATRSANAMESPDGSYTAGAFYDSTANEGHYVSSTLTLNTSVSTSITVFVKPLLGSQRCSLVVGSLATFTNRFYLIVDANGYVTANVGGASTLTSYNVEVLPTGWIKLSLVGVVDAASTASTLVRLYLIDSGSTQPAGAYLGTGKNAWGYWGLQVEASEFPSSLIPSTETFTSRASTATYYGNDGLIKTAAINEARLTYVPDNLTLGSRMLLEPSSSNASYSSDYSTTWIKDGLSIASTNNTSPAGDATASLLMEDTSTSAHYMNRYPTISSGNVAQTSSFFVKQYGTTRPTISLQVWGIGASDIVEVDFNFETGTFQNPVVFGNAWQTYRAQKLPNGWWRLSQTFILNDGASTSCVQRLHILHPTNGLSYTGDGTSGVYVWGAQIEAGYVATSYIPTTTASVTRSADVWSSVVGTRGADLVFMPTISDWFNLDEGTMVFNFHKKYVSSSVQGYLANINSTKTLTSPERYQLNINTFGKPVMSIISGSNAIMSSNNFGGVNSVVVGRNSIAYKIKPNQFNVVVNGVSNTTSPLWGKPRVSMMSIGGNITGTDMFLNGCIKQIVYYPTAISEADLERIT